jgi:predicted nuclease of predicted toxin-antitoxin system
LKLLDFKLLADENIHADVIEFLRVQGCDVVSVAERNLIGASDGELLMLSVAERRVVFTHDSDFGTLAILGGHDVIGIVYKLFECRSWRDR